MDIWAEVPEIEKTFELPTYKVFNHLSDSIDFCSIFQTVRPLGHLPAERIPELLGHDN